MNNKTNIRRVSYRKVECYRFAILEDAIYGSDNFNNIILSDSSERFNRKNLILHNFIISLTGYKVYSWTGRN